VLTSDKNIVTTIAAIIRHVFSQRSIRPLGLSDHHIPSDSYDSGSTKPKQ